MKQKFLYWIDNWGLFTASVFLLAFIPIYPKIPLFDILPGYIVRVRVEDILILGTCIFWFVQLWRKKIILKNPLTHWIGWYAVAGFAALLSGMFIVRSIPLELLHVGKSVLHYLRYLEYFSLFFIAVSSIRSHTQVRVFVGVLLSGLSAVILYAFGQKYLYWPVYSTMNREFSKGIRLYLTEHARVQSTFGGHYDLAAYLVVVLPIVLALALFSTRRWQQYGLWGLFTVGVWLITVSASRTSFAAFAVCAILTVFLTSLHKAGWREQIRFGLSRGLLVLFLISSNFWIFGADIRERLLQTLEAYPTAHSTYINLSSQTEVITQKTLALIPSSIHPKNPPNNAISTEEMEAMVASDQQPTTEKPGSPKPSDVFVEVPNLVQVATISASGSAEVRTIEVPRTYSDAALKYGLSLAIRLDTLWPRALEGFYSDPLFGSGYATLTKDSVAHFTEAESTDNNFLRTLGETGLFGFITFYGAVLTSAVIGGQLAKKGIASHKPTMATALGIGFICATLGLLLNAVYIDVFASSKVAFVYWSVAGLIIALWQLETRKRL